MKFKKLAWWLYTKKLPVRIKHPLKKGVEICAWDCATRGTNGKELTIWQLFRELRITARCEETDDLLKVYKKGVY